MSSSSSDTDRDSISPPASEDEAQQQPRLRPHAHRPSFSSSSRSASLSSSTPPSSATDEREDSKAPGSPGSTSTPSTSGSSPESRDALSHSIISSLDLESGPSPGRRTREPSIDASSSSGSSPRLDNDQEQGIESASEGGMPSLPPLVREDSTTRRVMEDIDPSPPRSPSPSPPLSMLANEEAESSGTTASRMSPSSYRAPSDFLGPMRSSSYGSSPDQDDTTSGLPSSTTTHDPEDQEESAAPHEPKTTVAGDDEEDVSHLPETIPTVSATGMPRLLPRRTDDPQLDGHVGTSSRRDPPPVELMPEGAELPARRRSSSSRGSEGSYDSDEDSDITTSSSTSSYAWQTPFPPLILALIPSSNYAPTRRLSVISSTILIHLGIPILNGFFVGLGEIFARSLVAPLVLGAVERGRSLWRGWQLYGGVGLSPWRKLTMREKMEARVDAGDGEGVGMEGLGVRAV